MPRQLFTFPSLEIISSGNSNQHPILSVLSFPFSQWKKGEAQFLFYPFRTLIHPYIYAGLHAMHPSTHPRTRSWHPSIHPSMHINAYIQESIHAWMDASIRKSHRGHQLQTVAITWSVNYNSAKLYCLV